MNAKCIVKIPETIVGNYKVAVKNFVKEWAEVHMEKDDNKCINAILVKISGEYGIVRFKNGLLLRLPVEYIRLVE